MHEAAHVPPLALDDGLVHVGDAHQGGVDDAAALVAVDDHVAGTRRGYSAILIIGENGINHLVANPEMPVGEDPTVAVVSWFSGAGADQATRETAGENLLSLGQRRGRKHVNLTREQRQFV